MLVRTLHTENEFRALEEEWNLLLQNSASNTIFLTWEWMHTWWKYYGSGKSLFIITVRDEEGRLVGLAPLCIKKVGFHGLASLKTLAFLGTDEVCSDYLDFITAPEKSEEVLKAVFDCLGAHSSLWDCILLSDMPETSGTLDFILNAPGSGNFVTEVNECPYIALPDTYESYLQGLGKNTRYNLGRRTKALDSRFKAKFSVHDGPDDIENALEGLFELHGKRREMIGKEGRFLLKNLMSFHREVSRILTKGGISRIYSLGSGRETVAMLYGFRYSNRFFYYQSGMDPEYEKQSVGMVLMGHCIRDSILGGLNEFDFLRGNEAYKSKWTKTSRKTVDIILKSGSLKGKAFMSAESLILKAKKLVKNSILSGSDNDFRNL